MRQLALVALLPLAACTGGIDIGPHPYQCDPDAGPDPATAGRFLPDGAVRQCPVGMRCGLEGFCHDFDGGPYLCTNDSWCDNGWHCNFQGVCASAGEDAVVQAYTGTLASRQVSPIITAQMPARFEASFPIAITTVGTQELLYETAVLQFPDAGPVEIDEAGLGFANFVGERVAYAVAPVQLADPILAMAAGPGSAWVLTQNPGANLVAQGVAAPVAFLGFDGGATLRADGLRTVRSAFVLPGAPLPPPVMLVYEAHDGGHLWPFLVGPPLDSPSPTATALFVEGAEPTFPETPADFASAPVGCETSFLLMASDTGTVYDMPLSLNPLPDGGGTFVYLGPWTRLPLASTAGPFVAGRIRAIESQLAAEDPSRGDVALFSLSSPDCQALTAQAVQNFDICPICGDSRVVEFAPVPSALPTAAAHCAAAGQGEFTGIKTLNIGPSGSPCYAYSDPTGTTSLFLEPKTAWGTSGSGVAGVAGSHGNLWVDDTIVTPRPFLVPDLAGSVMIGSSRDFLLSYSVDGTYAGATPGPGGSDTGLFVFAKGATGSIGMACEVTGDLPALVQLDHTVQVHAGDAGDTSATTSTVVAAVEDPSVSFVPPFHGVSFIADGGAMIVVLSTGQTIVGADVSPAFRDAGVVPLPIRAILPTGSAIISLASVSTPQGPPIDVYALTEGALFEVTGGLGDFRWEAKTLAIPQAAPLKLLSDGRHVRLALQDGRIYALSTGLQLAPALDGVVDVARFCGDDYALLPDGVYRLVPDGGVVGAWQSLGGVNPVFPVGDPGFASGLLREGTGRPELEAMTVFGELFVISAEGACP